MRFLLDNDVDVAVRRVLRRARHECWTAYEAGLAGRDSADDDEVSIYAQRHEAVVVTHDEDFSKRRIRNTFGKHLWLRCLEPDAAAMVRRRLRELEAALVEHRDVVVILASSGDVTARPPRWE